MVALAVKRRGIRVSARKEVIEQNRMRLGFERKLRLQMFTAFTEIGQQARREYTRHGNIDRTQREVEPKLFNILSNHYRAVINQFGLRVLRNNKDDTQFEYLVKLYIAEQGAERVQAISGTTRKQLQLVLFTGEQESLGNAVIGRRIFDSMNGSFSRYRAATIARTETHNAASYANHEVNASLKIPNQIKRWVSVADLRTRPSHASANGTEVGMDEDFIIGGMPMKYTGDPRGGAKNVINCRCVTLYISPEDEVIDETGAKPTAAIRPEDKPWGNATDAEVAFHNVGDWEKSGTIRTAIRKTTALKEVVYGAKRAYYSSGLIAMHAKKGFGDGDLPIGESTIWRHEYGHHMDFAMGSHLRNGRPISNDVVDDALKDRKMYGRAKRKKMAQDAEDSFFDMLKANGVTIDKDRYDMLGGSMTTKLKFLDEPRREELSIWITGLNIDEKFIDGVLRGSGFNADDLIAMYGGGLNKKGQISSGGAKGLIGVVNASDTAKERFLVFLHNFKANNIGTGNYGDEGYGNWLIRHSHDREGLMFLDFLEAMSNAVVGDGHGKTYLNKRRAIKRGITTAHTTEMMANYTALMGGERAKVWRKFLQRTAPNSLAKMDEIFAEIADAEAMQ